MTGLLGRGLDGLGRLELGALGAWYGVLFTLTTAQLAATIRDERTPSSLSWGIAIVSGAAVGTVVTLVVAREWRKHGGRRLQRLGRRVWWSGRLPEGLPERFAVLRDLERRERRLSSGWPAWVNALIWTVLVGMNLSMDPRPLTAVTWLALWTVFLVPGVLDVADRRSRARLRTLIDELRHQPLASVPPTAVG